MSRAPTNGRRQSDALGAILVVAFVFAGCGRDCAGCGFADGDTPATEPVPEPVPEPDAADTVDLEECERATHGEVTAAVEATLRACCAAEVGAACQRIGDHLDATGHAEGRGLLERACTLGDAQACDQIDRADSPPPEPKPAGPVWNAIERGEAACAAGAQIECAMLGTDLAAAGRLDEALAHVRARCAAGEHPSCLVWFDIETASESGATPGATAAVAAACEAGFANACDIVAFLRDGIPPEPESGASVWTAPGARPHCEVDGMTCDEAFDLYFESDQPIELDRVVGEMCSVGVEDSCTQQAVLWIERLNRADQGFAALHRFCNAGDMDVCELLAIYAAQGWAEAEARATE